jgi:hypothetical protein
MKLEEKRSGVDKVGRGSIPYLSARRDASGSLERGDLHAGLHQPSQRLWV